MVELKILNSVPLGLVEVKEKLTTIKKKDKELNFRANKTLEYLNENTKLNVKDSESLKQKLQDLNIPRLKEHNIIKIIDVMPITLESLKMLFTNEAITLKEEEFTKILEVIKEYA